MKRSQIQASAGRVPVPVMRGHAPALARRGGSRGPTLPLAAALSTIAAVLIAGPARADTQTAFSGFVDASYVLDTAAAAGEFGLDQVELDVTHRASGTTSLRADCEWLKDGDGFIAQVEQAYVEWAGLPGAAFTLGRFNAPAGFELLDPNEMYQFSHALVFTYGLPANLTGAMAHGELGGGFDARVYAANGWDGNGENNRVPTWGGRAGFSRGCWGIGISCIGGKEAEAAGAEFTRNVLDVDLTCRPVGWVCGGEVNAGNVETGGVDQEWLGGLVMVHRDFNSRLGLTVRYDYFDDRDGWAFGLVDGEPQTRQAVAIAPTLVLDEGFGALLEVRVDRSDRDAYVDADGDPTDSETTVAVEMTYAW